ncbi:hypothetical protein FB593_103402 [Rhizobium sp. SJZ105]|nr:hypothetical protein FB593_103402 [Rhizobium sp. SJZ105]
MKHLTRSVIPDVIMPTPRIKSGVSAYRGASKSDSFLEIIPGLVHFITADTRDRHMSVIG